MRLCWGEGVAPLYPLQCWTSDLISIYKIIVYRTEQRKYNLIDEMVTSDSESENRSVRLPESGQQSTRSNRRILMRIDIDRNAWRDSSSSSSSGAEGVRGDDSPSCSSRVKCQSMAKQTSSDESKQSKRENGTKNQVNLSMLPTSIWSFPSSLSYCVTLTLCRLIAGDDGSLHSHIWRRECLWFR